LRSEELLHVGEVMQQPLFLWRNQSELGGDARVRSRFPFTSSYLSPFSDMKVIALPTALTSAEHKQKNASFGDP